jgi:fructuronate reductase
MEKKIPLILVVPAIVSLLRRFASPGLHHSTWRIAMDSSQKFSQHLLGTIEDHPRSGAPIERLVPRIAGWMRYVTGIRERKRPTDLWSPLAERRGRLTKEAGWVAGRLAPALLEARAVL